MPHLGRLCRSPRRLGVAGLVGVLLCASASALAETPDAEARYWEARLAISSAGDVDAAIVIYRELLADPRVRAKPGLRARVLEALGRAHWSLAQLDAAREAFEACRRIENANQVPVDRNCAQLSRQVVLEQGAITTIPTTWAFEQNTTHGFVLFSEQGTMRREGNDDDGVLAWTQELDGETVADLAVGLRITGDAPTGVSLTVQAPQERTVLDLVVVDELGRTYEADKVFGADDKVRTWEVAFADMQPRLPSWPALEPGRISSLRLRASRPPLSEGRARHRILLDDVSFY